MESTLTRELARLERASDEHSRLSRHLSAAVERLAGRLCELLPVNEELPRGYEVRIVHSNIGSERFLTLANLDHDVSEQWGRLYINGIGDYLHGDLSCLIPPMTREGSLRFANDIATGLLADMAAWLEQRNGGTTMAAQALQSANDALKGDA